MITIVTEQVTAIKGELSAAVAEASAIWERKHPGVALNYIAVGPGLAAESVLAGFAKNGVAVEKLDSLGGRVAVGNRSVDGRVWSR
jgi:hypothetical protein